MKVVILCGGKGTRLKAETEFRPKPMLPIGNRPILWHIMKTYSHYGHTDFILCLGYKGDIIKSYFRNFKWETSDVTISLNSSSQAVFHDQPEEHGWNVTLANTGEESMTAYRIKQIEKYIGNDENFMLTYGDGVGNIDIEALLEFHHSHGKICTLTGTHPPGRFGELNIEGSVVTTFNEKPQAEGAYINGGYMVCNRKIFEYFSDDPAIMLEQEPMRKLAKDKELCVFKHDGFWQPMDNYTEFSLLNKLWASGKAPWKLWD